MPTSPVRSRVALVLALILVLASPPGALTAASSPAVTQVARRAAAPRVPASSVWAWVTVRRAAESYQPGPDDWGSNVSASTSVSHDATGVYTVFLSGIGQDGGTVLVSPLSKKPRICVPNFWHASFGDFIIEVHCFTQAGVAVDSAFVVDLVQQSGTGGPGKLAYAWIDRPSDSTSTPDLDYQFESNADTVTAGRTVGHHTITLTLLGSDRGHVQVTAFGKKTGDGGASPTTPAVCGVTDWHHGFTRASDMLVKVDCRDPSGALVDDRLFELEFMQGVGMGGVDGNERAYLLADRKTTASYAPDTDFSYMPAGVFPQITRQATGRYTVALTGLQPGGSAQVTAYGGAARHCVIESIARSGPQNVRVRCFDYSGNLADAKFTLAYAN